ncbi:MAG TPA: methyltransferase [Pyrinomonadaceae bacterium]|nr:methyltransferase [Pyrinomonadaceae bacterium]
MPEPDLEALTDLRTPWCVHVVATLRIADHIAAGKDRIDELAGVTNSDAYALHRVLTYLVGKGLFTEPAPGRFALNEAARRLLDPAQLIGLDLNSIGGRMAYAWGTLPTYVRTGKPAYHEIFGLPFWEDLDAHPDIAASFDALIGPTGHGLPNPEFEISGGWSAVRSVVDVGGGTGAMLSQILRRWPHLHGTLVDLPRTVSLADEIFDSAGVADRVTIVGQSFFSPLPPDADIYLLRGVINDWPDDEARMILSNCATAARPGGRVIVLGGVVVEEAPRDLVIEMVLVGGKKRSVNEFTALCHEAGLEVLAAARQPSGYFVTECRPRP